MVHCWKLLAYHIVCSDISPGILSDMLPDCSDILSCKCSDGLSGILSGCWVH